MARADPVVDHDVDNGSSSHASDATAASASGAAPDEL